ncbi:hypothetical protein [Nitrospirillum viridazoti]|uniref:Uncharacterized protein n=1 Tax=Nitrospirillum amazonense TaxID=28077 RepID=A0A560IZU3_9PROT|nr:hypothetical protein [Nitrospirillum amazonense]TWB64426.1 hypothetical protein FBZ92_101322 [Nitrospirillum amazonense]
MARFTAEQNNAGYVFNVEPEGISLFIWFYLGTLTAIQGVVALWAALNIVGIFYRYSHYTYGELQEYRGFFWGLSQTVQDDMTKVWAVVFAITGGVVWLGYRYFRNQLRLRRNTSFTVTRTAIEKGGSAYPLADIAEISVQVPGVPGAVYHAAPIAVAGGPGELGAVVLSSTVVASAATTTVMAAHAIARNIENARSASLEIRPKGSDKRTTLVGGLTAEVAHDLLDAVVAATRG